MRLIHPKITVQCPFTYQQVLRKLSAITATCYNTNIENKDIIELERYVLDRINAGHESILEHVNLTVTFTCDRGISHEIVRHRLCAFTQSSTRYINLASKMFEEHVTYIIPSWCESIKPGVYTEQRSFHTIDQPWSECAEVLWFNAMLETEHKYKQLTDKICGGWRPEQARSVLPNSLATILHVTANLREWRHILDLRAFGTTGTPHPQMRQIMIPLAAILRSEYGILFKSVPNDIEQDVYDYCKPQHTLIEVVR